MTFSAISHKQRRYSSKTGGRFANLPSKVAMKRVEDIQV